MSTVWLVVPLVVISLLSITINAYILLVVLFSRQATSANNLLLLHLGALNILLGIIFLVFSAPGLSRQEWLSFGAPCQLHGFMFTLLHPLVIWTICGLNADRYYAIAAPLHYGHLVNPRKVLGCLLVGWLVSLLLSLPPFFSIAPFRYRLGLGACVPDFGSRQWALWYSAAYTAFTLLLPATLIICCNAKILMIARYHRHRIASAIYEVTLSAQVTITHQRNPFFVPTVTSPSAGGPKFRGRSPVSSVLQLLGSFVLIYVPYYTVILWESSATFLYQKEGVRTVRVEVCWGVLSLLVGSGVINGFLYGVRSKGLRKAFQNYWRKKVMKSEVNQEIQARTPSTCGSRRQSLTPLGFFTTRPMNRRLSEAFLDVHTQSGKPQMKRIASELTWRPNSTGGLNFPSSPTMPTTTTSCNTLQVPPNNANAHQSNTKHRSAANLFMQKLFFNPKVNRLAEPEKSPKILITRAMSEDGDAPQTPTRRLSSSAGSLIEKHWNRNIYGTDNEESYSDTDGPNSKTKLLSTKGSTSSGEDSEDSSEQLHEEQALLHEEASSTTVLLEVEKVGAVNSVVYSFNNVNHCDVSM